MNTMNISTLRCKVAVLFATLMMVNVERSLAAPNGIETRGNARFTVITPNCVRLEYAPEGKFIDAPSLFAVNRNARFLGYRTSEANGATIIDTGAIRLIYKPDGRAFSAANLKASIRQGNAAMGSTTAGNTAESNTATSSALSDSAAASNAASNAVVTWTPGAPNPGNLGGTVTTLDGWDGSGDLGQGVLSRDGWYLLDDSRDHLFTTDWVQQRPKEAGTDWYLFGYGRDYKAALKSLTAIGGTIPLPRKYALGAWYSRYWPYSSDDYKHIVAEYAQHDFPLDTIVMDMDWHQDGWTGWSWNRKLIPDPLALLKWFHDQGLYVTLNSHPADGVAPHEDVYDTFMRDMGEDPAKKQTLPFDAGDKKYLETWFKDTHTPLENQGVDFWWLDWQQGRFTRSIPDLTNLFWLNDQYYKQTSRDGRRGLDLTRWGGWGSHRYPIQFSGDASTNWPMLAFEVSMTSTAGNVGCFFWSHDIGGHNRGRNEESYARWCQFGATSAALRSHSTRDAAMDRRPWTYPAWAEDSMRRSFHLRSQLFPYIYSSVWQAHRDTLPLNRPMYIEYSNQEKAYHNAQQYLFGDNLLVAPIVTAGAGEKRVGKQVVWFPPNSSWFNLFSGEHYSGGSEALVAAAIDEFPLYARAGVPIPTQPYTQRMATTPLKTLGVICYPGEEGRVGRFTLYEDDGLSTRYQRGAFATTQMSYTRQGNQVTINIAPTKGEFSGQVQNRTYEIELPCTAPASKVTLDGQPILRSAAGGSSAQGQQLAAQYKSANNTNFIRLPARSIRQGCTLVVQTIGHLDFDSFHNRAVARRGNVSPIEASQTLKQIVAASAAKSDPAERDIALSAAGLGFFNKNEEVYLYPDRTRTVFYAPPGLIDGENVKWSLEERNGNATKTLARSQGRVSQVSTVPLLISVSAPAAPSAKRNLRADLTIAGRPVVLRGPDLAFNFAQMDFNVARLARVTVSSIGDGYGSAGVIDGLSDGYPRDRSREWSSNKEKEGATLRLNWDTPQTIDRVWLFDRPNLDDQVTAGEITFSDGTKVLVGELPNDASQAAEVRFPARQVTWLKFKTTSVKPSTQNIGLSEIVVFKAAAQR